MNKRTSAKIASVTLFIHGFLETAGGGVLLIFPQKFVTYLTFLPWELTFAAALSIIFGLCRLIAGCAVWFEKKWGIVFGGAVSIATLIIVPIVYRAGVIGVVDIVLAAIALALLLYCWFNGETLKMKAK